MNPSTTKAVSAAAYGEDIDALDSWEDLDIVVERDGLEASEILLDASPTGLNRDDYAMGLPGVGIRLTLDQGRDLAISLLWQAAPTAAQDLWEALNRAVEDLRVAKDEPGNYDPDDLLEVNAQLDRWVALMDRISPPVIAS